MQAPQASPTQNQIASLRMRERDAIELPSPPFDAINPVQGLGSYLPTVGAVAAGAAAAYAIVVSGTGLPVLVGLVVALATIGLFFLFAYSAGYIRFGQRSPLGDVVKAATDELETGVLIVARGGEPIYANAAFETIAGRSDADRLGALQELCAGEPLASAALFRLARAAERGETLAEEFALRRSASAERIPRTLQLSVRPFVTGASEKDAGLVLWHIADVTAERQREAARLIGFEMQLAQFDSAPIGLASMAADGTLLHINATLARWIGRAPKSVLDQHLTLADIASGDGSALFSRLSGSTEEQVAALDVDLVREDGRIVPARLLARAVPSGKGLNAKFPAAAAAGWEISRRTIDAICRAKP